MDENAIRQTIIKGKAVLGIELGSTRIKAVLIGEDHTPLASGGHDWENRLENGVWTYDLKQVWAGVQDAYQKLAAEVRSRYKLPIKRLGAIGISAMMHGYLVFDASNRQLVPFRTWRNTITQPAAQKLTELFGYNIPQRWSIAHLYQAILNGEPHVKDIACLTTLSGYVHEKLCGKRVLGLGEVSGMFPVSGGRYDAASVEKFNALVSGEGLPWKLLDILPAVLPAGGEAGSLTDAGAQLLDPTGTLLAGAAMCPPEGDAGTGMVATNSVAPRTGNVSAGTSIFAMVVLEKTLSRVYEEIDMITTPAGRPVAMVHCNNCTGDVDAWVKLFAEVLAAVGAPVSRPALYDAFYEKALEGEPDGGGLLSYNYLSGEHTTGFEEGCPLFVRTPQSRLSLANFARTLLYSTMATLKMGMDILTDTENVQLEQLLGHGGLFKTKEVGQRLMAGALNVPVAVMESAGEGGAWGIALLAAYRLRRQADESLEDYLNNRVFAHVNAATAQPNAEDHAGFIAYLGRYKAGLAIERAAVDSLKQ